MLIFRRCSLCAMEGHMKSKKCVCVAALLMLGLVLPVRLSADVVVLTFEGLQDQEQVLGFYNGGTGSLGSGPGPAYGITFGDSALALIDADNGGSGNFANEPSPDTIAFFLSGGNLVMNVLAGFDTGFSFFYTSAAVGSITVYDALGGTGNILGSVPLGINWQNNGCTGDPSGDYCNWDPVGVAFGGTAYSVSFAGGVNQTGFDNISLGTETPVGTVPEPATLLLLGTALLGAGALFRRKRA
jgi:hypothetical protein